MLFNHIILISPKNVWKKNFHNVQSFKSIPGMTPLQLIKAFAPGGTFYRMGLIEMHMKMREEFGDIYKIPAMFGKTEVVTIFKPDDIEKVARNEGKFPVRNTVETLHYYRKNVRPDIYGEYGSLITEQNEEWYKMRTIVNPVLMKPSIVNRYIPTVDEISKEFVDLVLMMRDENNEVPADFINYLNRYALESIASISLNQRLGLLNNNIRNEKAEQLTRLSRKFFDLGEKFEIRPSFWKIYPTKPFRELMSALDEITNITIHYVEKAIEDLETIPGREESILEKLVKINKKVAVVMCTDALSAGIDTTTSAIVGILFCLAKNQDKQDKLREELRQNFPDPIETLTAEKMTNLPYLRAVIKEGMRLFPPILGTIRKTTENLVLCGHEVPKGNDVCSVSMLSYKSEEYFDEPNNFLPERWLKNVNRVCPTSKKIHPFAFLPFGFGPRSCVGKRIADMEIEVLLTRLIYEYKVGWEYPDIQFKSVLINVPVCDLKFKITKV